MGKGRMEAFSDAVIAVAITIMVLEMKVPHGAEWAALGPIWPVFVSHTLSFIYIGIYWNNHHHLMHAVHHVNGPILWANLHLLFWLSLVPFVTGWMGENHFEPVTVGLYGVVLLMSGLAYTILVRMLLAYHDKSSPLYKAIGSDFKGNVSLALYAIAIALTFVESWVSVAIYFVVAAIWFIPDRRIERATKS